MTYLPNGVRIVNFHIVCLVVFDLRNRLTYFSRLLSNIFGEFLDVLQRAVYRSTQLLSLAIQQLMLQTAKQCYKMYTPYKSCDTVAFTGLGSWTRTKYLSFIL